MSRFSLSITYFCYMASTVITYIFRSFSNRTIYMDNFVCFKVDFFDFFSAAMSFT